MVFFFSDVQFKIMLVNWKWLIHVISSFIFNYILLCLYLHVGIRKTPHGANTTEERI